MKTRLFVWMLLFVMAFPSASLGADEKLTVNTGTTSEEYTLWEYISAYYEGLERVGVLDSEVSADIIGIEAAECEHSIIQRVEQEEKELRNLYLQIYSPRIENEDIMQKSVDDLLNEVKKIHTSDLELLSNRLNDIVDSIYSHIYYYAVRIESDSEELMDLILDTYEVYEERYDELVNGIKESHDASISYGGFGFVWDKLYDFSLIRIELLSYLEDSIIIAAGSNFRCEMGLASEAEHVVVDSYARRREELLNERKGKDISHLAVLGYYEFICDILEK